MPSVGDAPSNAEPIARPRLDDNGLVTYSLVLPSDPAVAERDRVREPAPSVPTVGFAKLSEDSA